MKYKVGDKVRIRRDLSASDDGVNWGMAQLAGTITTITCVYNNDGVFLLDADDGEWFWTNEMLEDADADDKTVNPDYYKFHGYDVFDIADYFGLSFPLGNAIKYILRHKDETKRLQDLKKARRCLDRAIELMEKRHIELEG